MAIFEFDSGGACFWVAAAAGVLCVADEIAMTLTLDTWMCDVPSVLHARRLQAQARAAAAIP